MIHMTLGHSLDIRIHMSSFDSYNSSHRCCGTILPPSSPLGRPGEHLDDISACLGIQ